MLNDEDSLVGPHVQCALVNVKTMQRKGKKKAANKDVLALLDVSCLSGSNGSSSVDEGTSSCFMQRASLHWNGLARHARRSWDRRAKMLNKREKIGSFEQLPAMIKNTKKRLEV